ncbi:MAG: class I SAM-dependent methyltransferase [Thermoguttaceae bacterium]
MARNYNEFLVQEVLRHSRGAAVAMDFGAGVGTFACKLRECGLHVICIEPDASLRHALQSQGFECLGDIEQIPEGSVDYIFSLNVFEHIEDDTAMFRKVYRRLRPGGRFYLYVPAFPILYTSMDQKVGHYRRYRAHLLSRQLANIGFSVLTARYADSLGFLVTLLYRMIGNSRGDLNQGALLTYDRILFPLSRLLDKFVGRVIGKNLAVSAVRPLDVQAESRLPTFTRPQFLLRERLAAG